MRDFSTILLVLEWGFFLTALAIAVWAITHMDPFPTKKLRNIPFSKVEIGQTFYDYGGEASQLREYIKTDELEAKCLSIPGQPVVGFNLKDIVKIEIFR